MIVRELMAALAKCDPEMVVRMPDTYWQSEGYGERADDLNTCMPVVAGVSTKFGYAELWAEDAWDEDEDEGEEDEDE